MAKYEITILDTGDKLFAMALRNDGQQWVCDSTFELPYDEYLSTGGEISDEDEDFDRFFADEDKGDKDDSETSDLSDELSLDAEQVSKLPTEKIIEWLQSLEGKSFRVTHIPSPKQVSYFLFRDQNYSQVKKKVLKNRISERLREISDFPVSEENYSYRLRPDGAVLVGMLDERLPTVQMLEELTSEFGQKLKIHAIIPQEEILINKLKEMEAQEATIIHLQKGIGKLLIIGNGALTQPINVDITSSNAENKARTIVQRLLFEIEKGSIESLNQVFVSATPKEIEYITELLNENVPDLVVQSLTSEFEGEVEEVQNMSLSYAALAAVDKDSVITFLPESIRDRQQVFRLRWHGAALLLLLAATPLGVHEMYQSKQAGYENARLENEQLQTQIEELRPVVEELEQREGEFQQVQAELEQLKEDSRYATKWTQLIDELERGMNQIQNTWLTAYRSSDNGLVIEGYTIYRSRINDVAGIYPRSRIEQVSQGENRGHPVYSFTIRIPDVNEHVDPPLETDEELLLTESGDE